jgi:hypothetical protein
MNGARTGPRGEGRDQGCDAHEVAGRRKYSVMYRRGGRRRVRTASSTARVHDLVQTISGTDGAARWTHRGTAADIVANLRVLEGPVLGARHTGANGGTNAGTVTPHNAGQSITSHPNDSGPHADPNPRVTYEDLRIWRSLWVARLEGIEPPTHGLEGRCSIRLSYRRVQELQVFSLHH